MCVCVCVCVCEYVYECWRTCGVYVHTEGEKKTLAISKILLCYLIQYPNCTDSLSGNYIVQRVTKTMALTLQQCHAIVCHLMSKLSCGLSFREYATHRLSAEFRTHMGLVNEV